MHIADGVLSTPVVISGVVATGAITAYAISKTKSNELPKLSLLTGVFFVVSLISLPLPGPTCVHPMLAAFLGILLGTKAVIAVLVGLGLQAILLQYGGITTLGINTLLVTVPALIAAKLYYLSEGYFSSVFKRGLITAFIATVIVGLLLALVMYFSDERYAEGFFSLINFIIVSHVILGAAVEGPITGFALSYIQKARPSLIKK